MHLLVGAGECMVSADILRLKKVLPLLELPSLHGLARTIVTDSGPISVDKIALSKAGSFKSFGSSGMRYNRTVVRIVLGITHDVWTNDLTKRIVVVWVIGWALLLFERTGLDLDNLGHLIALLANIIARLHVAMFHNLSRRT